MRSSANHRFPAGTDGVSGEVNFLVDAPRPEGDVLLGIGTSDPRLSWKVRSVKPGRPPTRSHLELRRANGEIFVHEIKGTDRVLVDWPFAPLHSRERVEVRVAVGEDKTWGEPSAWTSLEAGLLSPSDWCAEWISPVTLGSLDDGAPLLFRNIYIRGRVRGARLYVTARGLYEFFIDGRRVGDSYLTPGWTAYGDRLRYQTYDVTEQVGVGDIRLSAVLGNGWFRGQLVSPGNRGSYGDRLSLFAQLEVEYDDGTVEVHVTDAAWQARPSAVLFDDLYDGEHQDRRIDELSESTRDPLVEAVEVIAAATASLVAPTGPPVRRIQIIKPVSMRHTERGSVLIDFGQNLVGFVRVQARGGAGGNSVVIRHAEVLEGGELSLRALRSAKATATYVLSDRADVLEPRFTFMGFRYAEISGLKNLDAADIEAVVVGSDLVRSGWFDSSDPALNQLHHNVVWSARGNLVDLPTDCPQRDERLGWTGDIQVFTPTATFLFDVDGFLTSWLRDLAAEQRSDGSVPWIVPDVLGGDAAGAAGWGDAAVTVPWTLWWAYGDIEILKTQYASMVAWVEYIRAQAINDLWTTGFQLGDWLDPVAPPENPGAGRADPAVVASAYYGRSVGLLARIADELGDTDMAEDYRALHERICGAFRREFVSSEGVIRSDCQTVYALTIAFDLLADPTLRAAAGARLAQLVIEEDFRIGTGFLGTPVVLEALTLAGRSDLAGLMLRQSEWPSWLYAVGMGATTIWERWDSMLPDGTVNPGEMTSFNHYAYGAVADWMHRRLAGLTALAPGYRRIRVEPLTTAGLRSVSIEYESPYGRIAVGWTSDTDGFELRVTVPNDVQAEIILPGLEPLIAGAGEHRLQSDSEPTGHHEAIEAVW